MDKFTPPPLPSDTGKATGKHLDEKYTFVFHHLVRAVKEAGRELLVEPEPAPKVELVEDSLNAATGAAVMCLLIGSRRSMEFVRHLRHGTAWYLY